MRERNKMFMKKQNSEIDMSNTSFKIGRGIYILSYLYIAIPFLIFAFGWMKSIYSIPFGIIILISLYKIIQSNNEKFEDFALTRGTKVQLLIIFILICGWVLLSGVGKFVFQNTDHAIRNTLFNILVEYKWPIINEEIISKYLQGATTATSVIYYIGFWLPASVFGKVFGLHAGYAFQYVWAVLGVCLVYAGICLWRKKIQVWPLIVMIFFSGMDIIGVCLGGENFLFMDKTMHIEWWSRFYQYSSMTSQLFWVFNQAIPAWLCTILVLNEKDNKNMVFILASCMLCSALPFIGLFVIVGYYVVYRTIETWRMQKYTTLGNKVAGFVQVFWKGNCTFQNVLGGGSIGIVSFLYLRGNISGEELMKPITESPSLLEQVDRWLLFIVLEIGFYLYFTYKYQKKNVLFYVVSGSLLIIPLLRVGSSFDFCMRASIPGLFILMIWVMDALSEANQKKENGILIGLLCVLLIGSMTPIFEINRTIRETGWCIVNGQPIGAQDADDISVLNGANFSGAIDGNLFFEYFAK